jgi:small subunit ribosomal protein S2
MSLDISMKSLLESGVHFGHRTNRWNPKMKDYIFTERNGIHIIDLQQTVQHLQAAYDLIRDNVAQGGTVLFVGTKRQAQETIQMEAERCGMPYVTERWLPGTLTNWSTIYARIMELQRLEKLFETGENERLVKKEQLMINRQIKRLLVHLSGIRHMNGLPSMIFIVDVVREITAVHEANLKDVPVVAMVDTNCDPNTIDYPIPSNDDAIRAIKLLVARVADAVLEGQSMRKEDELAQEELEQAGDKPVPVSADRVLEVDDQEIEEEDLLGEATLAKLNVTRKSPEEEEEDKETDAEADGEKTRAEEKKEVVSKTKSRKAKEEIADAVVEEVKAAAAEPELPEAEDAPEAAEEQESEEESKE